MERGYTERMARTQVLKARDESRDRFLEGIPKLLRVNSLFTSLCSVSEFQKAYWENKFC